ncbi:hypothetical protein [Paraburkholderia sp.]|uniref:hypothetical protein n=1 Tax=Paraburkholderia sp. TaxID=1926495 RepID=UPI0039E2D9DB
MAKILKEFHNGPLGQRVSLEIGTDNGCTAFYSVTTRTESVDPRELPTYDSAVFGPSLNGYCNAFDEFKKRVTGLLV